MAVLSIYNVVYRNSSGQAKHDNQNAIVAVATTGRDQNVIAQTIKTNLNGGQGNVTILSATEIMTGVQY